jgi:hypothetical protein
VIVSLEARYMRMNDGTESKLQQVAYQERSREWKSLKNVYAIVK